MADKQRFQVMTDIYIDGKQVFMPSDIVEGILHTDGEFEITDVMASMLTNTAEFFELCATYGDFVFLGALSGADAMKSLKRTYTCSDGNVYDNERFARTHQADLDIIAFVKEHLDYDLDDHDKVVIARFIVGSYRDIKRIMEQEE